MQTYKIELTEYEIELFKKFRELQTDIEILNDNDFFSFRNGSITVHKKQRWKHNEDREELYFL